jgi:uridine monophosphate synthetase
LVARIAPQSPHGGAEWTLEGRVLPFVRKSRPSTLHCRYQQQLCAAPRTSSLEPRTSNLEPSTLLHALPATIAPPFFVLHYTQVSKYYLPTLSHGPKGNNAALPTLATLATLANLSSSQVETTIPAMAHTTAYRTRANAPGVSPLASYLLRLMSIKQTNLCLSADVETALELLAVAEEVGDSICILKTHCDTVSDWTERTAKALKEIARRKHFLIFEDRKFADIGETVRKQYTGGYHRIADWAEITNAHVLPGPAIVTALLLAASATIAKYNTGVHTDISASAPQQTLNGFDEEDEDNDTVADIAVESPMSVTDIEGMDERRLSIKVQDRKHSVVSISTTITSRTESISPHPEPDFHPDDAFSIDTPTLLARLGEAPFVRGLLLIAEMSSEGHLMTPEYSQQCLQIARNQADFVMGFIAQRSMNSQDGDNFITMTPGCQLPPPGQEGKKLGDGMGQQYNTPKKLILEQKCDVIIVGRGITKAVDRPKEAERYRSEGWKAYEERIGVRQG